MTSQIHIYTALTNIDVIAVLTRIAENFFQPDHDFASFVPNSTPMFPLEIVKISTTPIPS